MSIIKSIKEYWNIANPFTINEVVDSIKHDTTCIINKLDKENEHINALEKQIKRINKEKDKYKSLVLAIGNTIPDMMWYKDTSGNYQYVNEAIRNELFYGLEIKDIIGRNDTELAKIFKDRVGSDNHTFGEICGNSDMIVTEKLEKQRFLEYGKIAGEDLYLEVYKAPIFNQDNVLIGTVGTGRDVTSWYVGLKDAIETNSCSSECSNKIITELDKFKFEV